MSHGSHLGASRRKCLQACVFRGLESRGGVREVAKIRAACCNDDSSGQRGTLREVRNFSVAERALRASALFVWVYESGSLEALDSGRVSGRWCLGCVGGECGGALVWLRQEQHVIQVVAEESEARVVKAEGT